MHVDLRKARKAKTARACAAPTTASSRPRRLRERCAICSLAKERLGRTDLALVSYHMGIGNLQRALSLYGKTDIPTRSCTSTRRR
jgi:hypothetical protein